MGFHMWETKCISFLYTLWWDSQLWPYLKSQCISTLFFTRRGTKWRCWVKDLIRETFVWVEHNNGISIWLVLYLILTSLVAQMIKCLPTIRETCVQSLGREDLMEKEMAAHSSTLAWKLPWMEELGRLQSMGSQRVRHNWTTRLPRWC